MSKDKEILLSKEAQEWFQRVYDEEIKVMRKEFEKMFKDFLVFGRTTYTSEDLKKAIDKSKKENDNG